nr:MAG TPA: hypothetical protein [Caudoviricetes sp.]DAR22354.1 MAG TPA: hypothetical protein [Caudoviricetes sp.]
MLEHLDYQVNTMSFQERGSITKLPNLLLSI